MSKSELEDLLLFQMQAVGLDPEREFMFAKPLGRRFRSDFCFKNKRLLIEVEGGIWSKGAHSRPAGILRDMEKNNLATLLGYVCLRFSAEQVHDGSALTMIEKVLNES